MILCPDIQLLSTWCAFSSLHPNLHNQRTFSNYSICIFIYKYFDLSQCYTFIKYKNEHCFIHLWQWKFYQLTDVFVLSEEPNLKSKHSLLRKSSERVRVKPTDSVAVSSLYKLTRFYLPGCQNMNILGPYCFIDWLKNFRPIFIKTFAQL